MVAQPSKMPSIVSPSRSVTIAFSSSDGGRPLAHATRLAALVRRPDAGDLHPEQLLDRLRGSAGFVASGAPRRRTRRGPDSAPSVFSVTIGRTMVRWRVGMLPPLLLGRALLRRALLRGRLLRGRLPSPASRPSSPRPSSPRPSSPPAFARLLRRRLLRRGPLRRASACLRAWRRIGSSSIGASVWPIAPRLDQHDVRPQDVIRRHVAVRHDVHVRQVAAAQEHVRLHAVREDEHLLSATPSRPTSAEHRLRLRRVVVELVDHVDRVLARARVERALARQRAHLARHVLRVAARDRTEHRAAAHPVRRAGRALTRAARALLLPRLLVAARPRSRGSSSTRCPGAGWRGTPSPPGASPACSPCRRTASRAARPRRAPCPAPCTRPPGMSLVVFMP